MKTVVKITKHHIDCGVAYSGSRCPTAFAILDAGIVRRGGRVFCCLKMLTVFNRPFTTDFPTPTRVVQFIRDFDHGRAVDPIEFEYDDTKLERLT